MAINRYRDAYEKAYINECRRPTRADCERCLIRDKCIKEGGRARKPYRG